MTSTIVPFTVFTPVEENFTVKFWVPPAATDMGTVSPEVEKPAPVTVA